MVVAVEAAEAVVAASCRASIARRGRRCAHKIDNEKLLKRILSFSVTVTAHAGLGGPATPAASLSLSLLLVHAAVYADLTILVVSAAATARLGSFPVRLARF